MLTDKKRCFIRKKIFIIHGSGAVHGIGKEAGGDLDTVAAGAFYTVWFENEIRDRLKREPVPGKDYDYDFVNYGEGLAHLSLHRGCDIYLPDFPIDALPPKLEMLYLADRATAALIELFAGTLFDLRIFICGQAGILGDYFKGLYTSLNKNKVKIISHQESGALKMALSYIKLIRNLSETAVLLKTGLAADSGPAAALFTEGLKKCASVLTGENFREAKKSILYKLGNFFKDQASDFAEKKEDILALEKAFSEDLTSKGRIGYSEEFVTLAVESAAYIERTLEQLVFLPFPKNLSEGLYAGIREINDELFRLFMELSNAFSSMSGLPESLKAFIEGIDFACREAVEVLTAFEAKIKAGGNRELPGRIKPLLETVNILLMEAATGFPVGNINILFEKKKGEGELCGPDFIPAPDGKITLKTDKSGMAAVYFRRKEVKEEFLVTATCDGMNYLLIPEEMLLEEGFDDRDLDNADGKETVFPIALELLKRHIDLLAANDVKIVSIDDHHPYLAENLEFLKKLKTDGVIGRVDVHSLPHGREMSLEKQRCGAELIYYSRVCGKPYDNPGLAALANLARVQDLHIEKNSLAISLSKLIGSKFSKVEMAGTLAKVKDRNGLLGIMESSGWEGIVQEYEYRLSAVLPRLEVNLLRLTFGKQYGFNIPRALARLIWTIRELLKMTEGRKNPFETQIIACLSPFCDPRKKEPQINVASAIGYLTENKQLPFDFFFYCYGSDTMTTRKADNKDLTFNLGLLMQFLGSRADGGHSGAATCKPSSNPAFPKKRLKKVGEKNFYEYLYYIVARLIGAKEKLTPEEKFIFRDIAPVTDSCIEAAFPLVKQSMFRVLFREKDNGPVREMLVFRIPRPDYQAGEFALTNIQIMNYLYFEFEADYAFIVTNNYRLGYFANMKPAQPSRFDMSEIAKIVGWEEDAGDRLFSSCSIRRNRELFSRFRYKTDQAGFREFVKAVGEILSTSAGIKIVSTETCKSGAPVPAL